MLHFFGLFLTFFPISLTSATLPSSILIHCPHPNFALVSILLTLHLPLIILSHALSFCFPPCLHYSDVLNLLRGLWKLSWWTTHRMKAQLDKRTASKAKYVLFNSWKYVSTFTQIFFSRSVIDLRKRKQLPCSCSKHCSHGGCLWCLWFRLEL